MDEIPITDSPPTEPPTKHMDICADMQPSDLISATITSIDFYPDGALSAIHAAKNGKTFEIYAGNEYLLYEPTS